MNSTNNPNYRRGFVLISALISLSLAGCTHTIRPPKEAFTAYAGGEKIHLKVGLNITDALLQVKHERHYMGDTWVIPIGPSLAMNAKVLARHTFDEVVDMRNGQVPPNETVAAILTPTVASLNRTVGATSFGQSIIDIKVEWVLKDSKGNDIWGDTIDGQSSGSTGWTNPKKVLKKALEDLLAKSQQAISSAPSIRRFAQKHPPLSPTTTSPGS